MLPTPTMTPWPGISRGTLCTVPIVPGLVRVTVAPWKSATVSLLLPDLADELLVGGEEAGEVERVGFAQHRHDERAGAVALVDVDGEAHVDVLVADEPRLAVGALDERVVHVGHGVGDRPHDGVADDVGEADLALPAAGCGSR